MTEPTGRFARLRDELARERARRATSTVEARRRTSFGDLRVSWLLLSVLTVIVVAVLVLAPSISLLIEQRAQIAAAEAQVAEQQQHVDELTEQVARWDDPSYIVAQARGRLYYVFPGEATWIVIDDRDPTIQAPRAEDFSDEITTTEVDWTHAVLSSFLVAGLTDAPPPDDALDPTSTTPTETTPTETTPTETGTTEESDQ